MALQSSGAISISQIKAELGSSSYSLRTLSAAAGKSTPDAMSEFYGYSSGGPITIQMQLFEAVTENCFYRCIWDNGSGTTSTQTVDYATTSTTGSYSTTGTIVATVSRTKPDTTVQDYTSIEWLRNGSIEHTATFSAGAVVTNQAYTYTGVSGNDTLKILIYEG